MPQLSRILRAFSIFAFLGCTFPLLVRAGTWVAFQNSYTRGTGSPVTVTSTFSLLNPNTQYTLKAFNGGLQNDTTELVSFSIVSLNGVQVVGPSNFNQGVTEVNVTIFPGVTNTLSVQVRGKPGGVLTIQVIGVDNDPPTITASVSPAPNAAGWNNSPVMVSFTCSDKTSGVASCPSPVGVSTEGANQAVSGTATDLAGNTASTSVTINLDMTPPTITGTINPAPDAGGYNSGPVTVTFNCADALSGVASCSPAVSVSGEGSFPESGTGVDVAGNTASATVTVNISLSYFKIRSWQTNPGGDPAQTGKCLDYGASPSGNGASVFLNDCASAHSIRVMEIGGRDQKDAQGNVMFALRHEVLLFAGKGVIGAHNLSVISLAGTSPPPQSATEYQLEVQAPFFSPQGSALFTPAEQIWRLDGDSIILEGSYQDPTTGAVVPGPCINSTQTAHPLCPFPQPQLVVQVQNARGTSGSPLVASTRNLADSEFWDFISLPGSRPYPTTGFTSMIAAPGDPPSSATPITTNWQLWNAICGTPQVQARTDYALIYNPAQPYNSILNNFGGCSYTMPDGTPIGWGTVIVVAGDDPFECQTNTGAGACIDLSGYPAIQIPAGVTIRGNRRGTNFGPQLSATYDNGFSLQFCHYYCMLQVTGDYVRVTGLRLRGQSRSMDTLDLRTNGIEVDYATYTPPQPPCAVVTPPSCAPLPPYPLFTINELITTIDHNDMSDWEDGAIDVNSPFFNESDFSIACSYTAFVDPTGSSLIYPCGQNFPQAPNVPFPPSLGLSPIPIAEDPINPPGPGTLANVLVSHNFLHHNMRNEGGYGVGVQGRAFIYGNTFSWNRHDITANGDPHYEYRASHNLVLSGAPVYPSPFIGRLQDFDQHGTDLANDAISPLGGLYLGGAGGYYVEIDGNTFLGGDGHDYVLRGFPIVSSYYHDNVSRRKESDAVHFYYCPTCVNSDTDSPFPIVVSNSVFGQTSSSPPDPTATLGVGDFDGDGDDDLFMATGNTWFYSPAGRREWRYLNSAPDTIYQLLLGDFDGDGRTDVVALRNGQLVVSWGGISAFEVLNYGPLPCSSMTDMAVGDFDGDGNPDIFCADGGTWWISYGGNTPFVQVIVADSTLRKDLRFGDFNGDGTTDVFGVVNGTWMIRPAPKGYQGLLYPWKPLPVSLTSNPASADGLVVADFNGDGIADVGMSCNSVAAPGWQISYGGAQGWSSCNTYASQINALNCFLSSSPCVTLANGAVGRFSGGSGSDILLWNYTNSQGAAPLLDMPGGTGAPYVLSSQDMH